MEKDAEKFEHIREILLRLLNQEPAPYSKRADPPYDSPIETIFAENCFKHLDPNVNADKQVKILTKHGGFFLDFLISTRDCKVGVECDGEQFHEGLRDELRDAIILGEGHVDTIYHFRGCDITYYPDDCTWLMSILDPKLFSERGRFQLDCLHRLELDKNQELANRESFMCQIWHETHVYHFWAFRRSAKMISAFPHLRYHWKVLYDFACEHPGMSLDTLLHTRMFNWESSLSSEDI